MIGLVLVLDAATPAVAATPPADPLTVTVAPGVAWGYFSPDDIAPGASPLLALDVGYRVDEHASLGGHLTMSHLSGTYFDNDSGNLLRYDYSPLFLAAFARAEALNGWLWGELALGLHVDNYHDQFGTSWSSGLAVGLTGGFDIYKVGRDRLGAFIGIESELQGQAYEAFSLGIAYRR